MAPKPRPLEERFWERVDRSSTPHGCWPWIGQTGRYGRINDGGRSLQATHVALMLDGRPVPSGMYACHRCDNTKCVRASHLFVGTAAENSADMVGKNRGTRGRRRPGTGPSGTRNAKAKLTFDDVLLVRDAYASGENIRRIAARFGVSKSQVWNIVSNAQRRAS